MKIIDEIHLRKGERGDQCFRRRWNDQSRCVREKKTTIIIMINETDQDEEESL